jgi:hypothetical protein
MDYNGKRDPRGASSLRIGAEYECQEKRRRRLSLAAFAEPMANGEIVASIDTAQGWYDISPGHLPSGS